MFNTDSTNDAVVELQRGMTGLIGFATTDN
jgi:hypothetical protein